ncbi:hypothetical protein [Streptomyces sp. 039-1]|uniref:hypothetical protein n=2 Tax=unclassified Streptomyces TaxID=2593676 RepID=UPI0039F4EB5F
MNTATGRRHRFTGTYQDPMDLHHMGARDYDCLGGACSEDTDDDRGGYLTVGLGKQAVTRDNAFGRANAAADESAVRLGPVVAGSFLLMTGVPAAVGVIQVEQCLAERIGLRSPLARGDLVAVHSLHPARPVASSIPLST